MLTLSSIPSCNFVLFPLYEKIALAFTDGHVFRLEERGLPHMVRLSHHRLLSPRLLHISVILRGSGFDDRGCLSPSSLRQGIDGFVAGQLVS